MMISAFVKKLRPFVCSGELDFGEVEFCYEEPVG